MTLKKASAAKLNLTVNDLIGKQSVRATFRLPQEVIDLLGVIAGQLGLKKKSLFDQLIENQGVLRRVAQEARMYHPSGAERRRRTFVISRNSLHSLNSIAEEERVSRDILVEVSIRRLLPVIKTELDKHNGRKQLQKEMAAYLRQGNRILRKSAALLGKDDRIYAMLEEQVSIAGKNLAAIDALVKKGMIMEDW